MNEDSIFLEALEMDSAEVRSAFLDQACAGNAELRDCVERLLRAHERADEVLHKRAPGLPATSALAMSEHAGTKIGPYKLLQQIGEGGMGVVYMADQEEPVRRRVALKIIKPGMDSRQVIGRFEAERQALAMMDHQHIARVLDAGTTDSGRPYFVMELVHGIPITKFCDDSRLTLRERLQLFVPVCHAIQHAHQKGIIHRDIKPSNVLVTMYDDKPVPKVIDFGVAKAVEQRLTEKTLFTQFGTLVGTFEYMSPEQAEMNAFGVDTRSDVYSLGVLLYELLTGTTPLERPQLHNAALVELVRLIKEQEPPRPSIRLSTSGALPKIAAAFRTDPAQLSKLMRGELDWIVMKCLEKDRTRRYDTASGLARDIDRFLNDEPVEACSPSLLYRVKKLAYKQRGLLTAAAAFLALILAATIVSSVLAVREHAARVVSRQNEQRVIEEQQVTARERDAAVSSNEKLGKTQEQLRQTLYSARINAIADAWATNSLWRVRELLAKTRPTADETDLRAFEWYFWLRQLHGELQAVRLPAMAGPARPVLSSSGNRMAGLMFGSPQRVQVRDTATGQELIMKLLPANVFCRDLQLNHDGTRLAWIESEDTRTSTDVATRNLPVGSRVWGINSQNSPMGLRVWDINSQKRLLSKDLYMDASIVPQVYFDREAARVAVIPYALEPSTAGKEPECRFTVWDVDSGDEIFSRAVNAPYKYVGGQLSPDGLQIAAIAANREEKDKHSLTIWNVLTESQELDISVKDFELKGVTFVPRKNQVILSGASHDDDNGRLQVVDVASGHTAVQWYEPTSKESLHCTASTDGELLAIVSSNSPRLRVRDAETHQLLFERPAHTAGIDDVAFVPDGSRLLTISMDGELKEWAVPSTSPARTLAYSGVNGIAITADGARAVLWKKVPKEFALVEIATGRELSRWPDDSPVSDTIDHRWPPRISLSPDGKFLALFSTSLFDYRRWPEPYLGVWETASGKKLYELGRKELEGSLTFVQFKPFSPDGTRLVLCTVQAGASTNRPEGGVAFVRIIDAATGRQVQALSLPRGYVAWCQAFSADGRWLACAGGTAYDSSFNSTGLVLIWDLENAQQAPKQLEYGSNRFFSVAFQPQGGLLAAGTGLGDSSTPGEIVLWRLTDSSVVHSLKGHERTITELAFTPNGRQLASFSGRASDRRFENGQVKLWDVSSGQERLSLNVDEGRALDLMFTSDGYRLVAPFWRFQQSSLRVWDATPLPIRVEAQDVVARVMDERRIGAWRKSETMARLKNDNNLHSDLRRAAIEVVESLPDDFSTLNDESWSVVWRPGQSAEAYRHALQVAERAAAIAGDDEHVINTLGVAQYRVGRFAEAKFTLMRSLILSSSSDGTSPVVDLAFLAMACHKLNQQDEAAAYLERLREQMKQPSVPGVSAAYMPFLQEAEAVLASNSGEKAQGTAVDQG